MTCNPSHVKPTEKFHSISLWVLPECVRLSSPSVKVGQSSADRAAPSAIADVTPTNKALMLLALVAIRNYQGDTWRTILGLFKLSQIYSNMIGG